MTFHASAFVDQNEVLPESADVLAHRRFSCGELLLLTPRADRPGALATRTEASLTARCIATSDLAGCHLLRT
jgi:hypothetical protein